MLSYLKYQIRSILVFHLHLIDKGQINNSIIWYKSYNILINEVVKIDNVIFKCLY